MDPPTLINLGVEWMINGDDNRNASVAVPYRKRGDAAWTTALLTVGFTGRAPDLGALERDVPPPHYGPRP